MKINLNKYIWNTKLNISSFWYKFHIVRHLYTKASMKINLNKYNFSYYEWRMVVLECLVLDIEDVKAYVRPCEISMTIFFSSFTSVCTDTRLKCTNELYKIHINCKPFNETKMRWKCKFLCHVYTRCLWKFSFVKNARYAMFCLGKNTQPDNLKLRTHHYMARELDFYMEIFLTSNVKWYYLYIMDSI